MWASSAVTQFGTTGQWQNYTLPVRSFGQNFLFFFFFESHPAFD